METNKLDFYREKLKEKYARNEYILLQLEDMIAEQKLTKEVLEQLRTLICDSSFLKDSIKSINGNIISDNPYFKNIAFSEKVINGYELSNRRIIRKGKIESYDEMSFDLNDLVIKPNYFICDEDLICPVLGEQKEKSCWMSVEPFEINSFKKIIEEAKGDVLLLGLGLGYAAYMICEKENVSSVTVVELDENVINLFESNILNQIPNKNKIKIINDDALEFLSKENLNLYDYINLDIYKSVFDMLKSYLYTLNISEKYPNVKFSYWLENELKTWIQGSIVRVFSSINIRTFSFDIIAKYILENAEIKNIDELKELIKLDDFRKQMLSFYQNNPNALDIDSEGYLSVIKSYGLSIY